MQFSSADKALYLKIVYYGPGLSGKTTNLETLHRLTDPQGRRSMVSLRTQEDRTLFFDLLPFDLGRLYGLNIRIKLFTVPGQIQYDTTRKQVLAGADGVVFVADSQRKQLEENARMARYLANNLQDNGLDPKTIPLVFQWNKQDLHDLSPAEEMERRLNPRHVPAIPAIATDGTGVIETFQEIAALTIENIATKAPALPDRLRAGNVREELAQQFASFIPKPGEARRPAQAGRNADPAGRLATVQAASDDAQNRGVLGLDELLQEAVHANLAISEQLIQSSSPQRALRRDRQALAQLVRVAGLATSADSILKATLQTILNVLELGAGSILLRGAPNMPLRELHAVGHETDPLNGVQSPGIGSVATALLSRGEPVLCQDIPGELLFGQTCPAVESLRSVLALPVGNGRPAPALVLVYADTRGRDLSGDDVELATLVTGIANLGLRAAAAARRQAASPVPV
jgi:signal recognition particle receptor subunit beta